MGVVGNLNNKDIYTVRKVVLKQAFKFVIKSSSIFLYSV